MADPAPLLAGTQAGDRAAFESLIRSQSKRLYALACRVTGDSSMAEDVVQDTFLRILEGRSPLRQKGAAQAWLAQVTTRVALDQVRRRKARRSREEEHAMVQETRDEQPVERLMASEQAFLLSEALASLPVET